MIAEKVMENEIPQSTFKPGDFDYPSDESDQKDMEYDQSTI